MTVGMPFYNFVTSICCSYTMMPTCACRHNRLRNKEDEEDSDAEDEELPFTPEEVAAHNKELEKHKQECEKVHVVCISVTCRVCGALIWLRVFIITIV